MKNDRDFDNLRRKLVDNIETREARICVVGLGYVGLPLAISFGEANFRVIGIDVDGQVVKRLNMLVCFKSTVDILVIPPFFADV